MSSATDALSVLERRMLARVRARNLCTGYPESKACIASCPSLPMSMSMGRSQVVNAGPPLSTNVRAQGVQPSTTTSALGIFRVPPRRPLDTHPGGRAKFHEDQADGAGLFLPLGRKVNGGSF
jgi:hypothetical protein